MRGKLSLHTVHELTFVLVFVPAIAVATQNTEAKADQPQGPVKEPQKVTAPHMTEQPAVDQSKLNIELLNSIMRGNVNS